MRARSSIWGVVGLSLVLALPLHANSPAPSDATGSLTDLARAYVSTHAAAALSGEAMAGVPSFARQTGLACSACHYQFLALTPFGRKFKLSGYTLNTRPVIAERDSASGGQLDLSPFSLVSAMLTSSMTHLKDPLPDTQNSAVLLPQEFSVFLAGAISSKVGLFSQYTYSGPDGAFGIDNLDIRYANSTELGGSTDMVYGLTLNNNPSIQDLWNSTPAWGFPFTGSPGAPGSIAGPVIDGAFGQNVLGLGAYTMLGGTVYAEFSAYRSAIQGFAAPTIATGAINGVAPYWRLALQKDWGTHNVMVGTYGMHASVFPAAVSGPTNRYTDVGVDAQYETQVGSGNLVARGTYIHEAQTLDATFAAGGADAAAQTLKTLRFNASYYPSQKVGLSAGYFTTTGSTDATLYAANPVDGSANGSPDTRGITGEVDFNPWENTRVGVQYTAYSKFNGGSTNYDGSGRNASSNNPLFLFVWLAF